MAFEKKYVCVSTGKTKEEKKPYSRWAALKEYGTGTKMIDFKDTFSDDKEAQLLQVVVLKG